MNLLFSLTVQLLQAIAAATGLTYNEINIIIWYMLLPLVYLALLDRILRWHVLKIGFILGWIAVLAIVRDFDLLSDRLFAWSVEFLRLFAVVGMNYLVASVIICLVLPGLALVALLFLAYPNLWRKLFPAR